MFRKLEALSAAALMILSISLAGCCGGGALCPHAGGGCAAQQALAPVSVDSCSSCAQQTYAPTYSQGYSTPAYSQPTYSQSTYAQPAYSGGSVVNGSFSPTPAVQGLGSGTTSSVFSGAAPSLGSGTSAPVFSGGSGSR